MSSSPTKPTKNRSYDQCNHVGCETTRNDRCLLACRGCGVARYCSKECQKGDWKNHKVACKAHQTARDAFKTGGAGEKEVDLYGRVSKWVLKHRPALGDAMVASLNLPKNPQRQRRQVLAVDARYLPNMDDEHCLLITSIHRTGLNDLLKQAGSGPAKARLSTFEESRRAYEEQSLEADPDTYGTGLVLLTIFTDEEPVIMRGLPITFDHEMANEIVQENDSVWQHELLRQTKCASMYAPGSCCFHGDHDHVH